MVTHVLSDGSDHEEPVKSNLFISFKLQGVTNRPLKEGTRQN